MAKKDSKTLNEIKERETNLSQLFQLRSVRWDRNILKYQGYHWIEYMQNSNSWRSAVRDYQSLDRRYPTPVTNYVFDQVYTVASNIIQGFPLPYARNRVNTPEAKKSANFQDTLLKYYCSEENWDWSAIINDIINWCLITGGCLAVPYWDLDTGRFVNEPKMETKTELVPTPVKSCQNCATDNPMETPQCLACGSTELIESIANISQSQEVPKIGKNGQPLTKKIPIGDPSIRISPYYEFLFDPHAQDLNGKNGMGWIMHREVKDTDWVNEKFNSSVKPNYKDNERYLYSQRVNSWVGGQSFTGTGVAWGMDKFSKNMCTYKRFWKRPQKISDKGQFVVVAGDEIVHEAEFPPEWDGQFNWSHSGLQR